MDIQREDEQYIWATCLNPDHEDKNASLCINKVDSGRYKKGYGYCYSCGFKIQFSKEVIDKVSNKKSACREKRPIDWGELTKKFKGGEADYRTIKLAFDWNLSPSSLKSFGIGWDGEAFTFPMFDPERNITGIQRRYPGGKKMCVHGSQLGLFLPDTENERVVITEGLSDAAVATHLGYYGMGKPSAGFGSELVRKYLENIKELEDKGCYTRKYTGEIIIVADNDSAGTRSRVKLQESLKNWKTRVVVPDTDLKDYYLDNGANTTRALLEL